MRVAIDVPDDSYWKLQHIAKGRGVEADDLIEQLVAHALKPKPKRGRKSLTDEERETIRQLWSLNWSDNSIAEHMGRAAESVRRHRIDMGLSANNVRRPGNYNNPRRKAA